MQSIEQLASCEKITEWVNLNDLRLVEATGEPAPNRGKSLRENWRPELLAKDLELEIARLLVPSNVTLAQPITAAFDADEWRGETRSRVFVNFASEEDWLQCFPLGDTSRLPTSDDDWHAWAGVALCGNVLGLGVFAEELFKDTVSWEGAGVQARVQPVPEAIFQRIVSTK